MMIDELSLGLAPSIVAELLRAVQTLKEQGTTVILVEQSVNVALTVAETAYFMEKGEIRFHGPTSELLERPDVLRSVFLEGAASVELDVDGPAIVHVSEAPVTEAVATAAPSGNGAHDDPRLSARGIWKHFGGISALSDVSFDVAEGEVLGFLGPNGAGKTTLFDVLCGYLPCDRGEVLLDGSSIGSLGPDARARRGLGSLVPGRAAVPRAHRRARRSRSRSSGASTCATRSRPRCTCPSVADSEAKVRTRVEELIELLGLGAFRDKYIRELSTGSRRVVDLACVLAHGPRVLFLDEPSSGIAQREAEALGPLLLRIRRMTGASLLIIEHDVPLLTSIADRMIALDLGEIVAVGTPDEVIRDPSVVASYLGESEAVVARSGPRLE